MKSQKSRNFQKKQKNKIKVIKCIADIAIKPLLLQLIFLYLKRKLAFDLLC